MHSSDAQNQPAVNQLIWMAVKPVSMAGLRARQVACIILKLVLNLS